jgi:hypothetical protein
VTLLDLACVAQLPRYFGPHAPIYYGDFEMAEPTDTTAAGAVNGDRVADFQIELTGLETLTAGDFAV